MLKPTFSDYVETIRLLFEEYQHQEPSPIRRGRKQTYQNITLILFFTRKLPLSSTKLRFLGSNSEIRNPKSEIRSPPIRTRTWI